MRDRPNSDASSDLPITGVVVGIITATVVGYSIDGVPGSLCWLCGSTIAATLALALMGARRD